MLEVTEVYLTQRPGADNSPSNGNFGVRKTQLQAPVPSSMDNSSTNNKCVIVKSLYLSVDPALRQTLNLFCTSTLIIVGLSLAKCCKILRNTTLDFFQKKLLILFLPFVVLNREKGSKN